MNNELLIKILKSNNSEVKSNNEEKQIIEEMAKVLKDYTERNHIMASHVILECYAEELYSKNYRKQREGENSKGCEYCKGRAYTKKPLTVITKYGRRIELVFEFCPNCGRKMKGGAE